MLTIDGRSELAARKSALVHDLLRHHPSRCDFRDENVSGVACDISSLKV
ncbi:MAG: hypothetical protein Q8R85_20080 [Bosea sp. (in: a-proteobacteria)]|nr:hypothetical protein [Bosea sp. (in: a-proteobacteria)]MDP3603466.1 hypothetical protein [Bosea sp. (in: a-proteobacteria)]